MPYLKGQPTLSINRLFVRQEYGLSVAASSDFSREAGKLDYYVKHLNFQMLAQFSSLNPMWAK